MTTRPYKQTARALAAEATRTHIADTALRLFLERHYDEVGLREVAAAAGVAVQTVVNHFGTKDGLFLAVIERFDAVFEEIRSKAVPDDVRGAAEVLAEDYERSGDGNVRALALEDRIPAVAQGLAIGRKTHRDWVERTFPGALEGLAGAERRRRLLALCAVTDVTTWKYLRRDNRLSKAQTVAVLEQMIEAHYRDRRS